MRTISDCCICIYECIYVCYVSITQNICIDKCYGVFWCFFFIEYKPMNCCGQCGRAMVGTYYPWGLMDL